MRIVSKIVCKYEKKTHKHQKVLNMKTQSHEKIWIDDDDLNWVFIFVFRYIFFLC